MLLPNGDPRHQDSAQFNSGIKPLRIETESESETLLILNPYSTSTTSSAAMYSK